jgi:hypothetical protein
MAIGEPLPTLPIWLTPDLRVLLPLESNYQETCEILFHLKCSFRQTAFPCCELLLEEIGAVLFQPFCC